MAEDSTAFRALGEDGLGHPGQHYLLYAVNQIGFLVQFAQRIKEEPPEARREILADPWRTRDVADADPSDSIPGMRHVLLHLLHPDEFERISNGTHKQRIVEAYAGLVPDTQTTDVDEELLAIRRRLTQLLDKPNDELDFYSPPLDGTWRSGYESDGAGPAELLELKRQLVFFGPPGTSKTYEAKQLAEQVIRRAALRQWGAARYFENQPKVADAVQNHVRRLQLHPAYSYEEFIRGLRLRDGETKYEDGYLLRLIDEIEREAPLAEDARLPWVLILDELNRADLSRVFGEAFSVLEDRNSPVDLPGGEPGEPPRRIQLPERLFVIGTMNLIDQSLEQIDFALRRRFLWRRSGFDRDRLGSVLQERWEADDASSRYRWRRVAEEMALFVDRAAELNRQVGESHLLGRDYEIGHTYFFDVVGLLARAEHLNRRSGTSQFLWNRRGEARQPVSDLWQMSLEPLLDQYLQGVESDARRAELDRLGRVFLVGASR